jgi:hypothetical protein
MGSQYLLSGQHVRNSEHVSSSIVMTLVVTDQLILASRSIQRFARAMGREDLHDPGSASVGDGGETCLAKTGTNTQPLSDV